jgi:hypothetical protein
VELLKKIEIEEELRRVKREGMLNILPLAVRLPPHSSSSLECAEGKVYNEKIQFPQTIIQNINTIETSKLDFLHKSRRHWCARE